MFQKTPKSRLTKPTNIPVGSFVKTEKGYFFIKSQTERSRFISERVLRSWAPPRIVLAWESAVKHYRIASKVRFRNGSLIWNVADGKVYLIEAGKRRWITSPDAYRRIGLEYAEVQKQVIHVSNDEVILHPEGENLN